MDCRLPFAVVSPLPGEITFSLNSTQFALFAVLAVLALRTIRRGWARILTISVSNSYFLMQFCGDWPSLAVLGGIVLATWAAGQIRVRLDDRFPAWAVVSLVAAFWGLLFFLKAPDLAGLFPIVRQHPIAVVGLSYIIFRCIQYVMDISVLEDTSLVTFANYVLFFPTLLAGPVERHERFVEFQRGADLDLTESPLPALHRIVNGCFKKFVLADHLAVFGVFAMPREELWPTPILWLGVLLQPVLLYLDMSGYCDIMIGLVRLCGFRLAENFRRPWKARTIQDFWGRWHITVSGFVKDYVFTPAAHAVMRGAAPGWHGLLLALSSFGAMMLIALWHGFTWGFFVFGVAHGLALLWLQVYRALVAGAGFNKNALPAQPEFKTRVYLERGLTYLFVAVTMMLWFYGPAQTGVIVRSMLGV